MILTRLLVDRDNKPVNSDYGTMDLIIFLLYSILRMVAYPDTLRFIGLVSKP